MDNLDLLKQKWQSTTQELPKLSYQDIHKMLLKKSSSIVKWIFLISILELLFWTILTFFVPESSKEINERMGLKTTFIVVNILHYAIFAVFIYIFYKNYQTIKVTGTIKDLMASILKTRKTVRNFVVYNVSAAILLLVGVNIVYYNNKTDLYNLMTENYEGYGAYAQDSFTTSFFVSQFVLGIFFVGLILLFYRVIYGVLLKRLKRNYTELEKMEV
jgi:membrane-associated HD superfamily phosphohydrolase